MWVKDQYFPKLCSIGECEKRPFSFSALPYTQIKLSLQLAKLGRSRIYVYGIPIMSRLCLFLKMFIHMESPAWLLTQMDRSVYFPFLFPLMTSHKSLRIIICLAYRFRKSINPWCLPLAASENPHLLDNFPNCGPDTTAGKAQCWFPHSHHQVKSLQEEVMAQADWVHCDSATSLCLPLLALYWIGLDQTFFTDPKPQASPWFSCLQKVA